MLIYMHHRNCSVEPILFGWLIKIKILSLLSVFQIEILYIMKKNNTLSSKNPHMKSFPLLILIALLCCPLFSSLQAQIVTGIYTDFDGFWHSTSTSINSTKPDNDHNLLAFTVKTGSNVVTYSTGVNDDLLDDHSVSPYTNLKFRALPVSELPTSGATTGSPNPYLIGFGQLTDGIDNGQDNNVNNSNPFSAPLTAQGLAGFLTDGPKGLNLGTCLTNIPNVDAQNNTSEIRFELSTNGITQAAIDDGVPDVLFSQVAEPNNNVDKIRFVDGSGNTVGNVVSINFTNNTDFPVVGSWTPDFYALDKTFSQSAYVKAERNFRFFAKDLSAFGITTSNYQDAKALIFVFGGSSDPAFIAYNEPSIGVASQIGIVTDPVITNCDGTLEPITVQLQDSFGDPVKQVNYEIAVTLISGPGSLNGTKTVLTDANGEAIFDDLEFEVGGSHTIEFTTSSLGSDTVITSFTTCNDDDAMIWTGAESTAWNEPGNWSISPGGYSNPDGIFPNENYNVLIPNDFDGSAVPQYPILNVNTGAKDLELESGASINLGSHVFGVVGVISKGNSATIGTISGNTEGSELYMVGSIQQTLPEGLLGGNDLYDLTLDNSNGVVMNSKVRITNMLNVKQGTFNIPVISGGNSVSNARVVLGCSFAGSGQNAQIRPLLGNAKITGDIVTEQCFPARRAFRFVSSPVSTTTSIHENWQEGAMNYLDSDPEGYGTHITGIEEVNTPGDDGQDGFDYSPSGKPSMFSFNNATGLYVEIPNTDQTNLDAGDAYRLMIRGDRTINITSNAATPTKTRLRTLGTVKKGPFIYTPQTNFNASVDAYNFFGNPFPAAVNMRKVFTNSLTVNVNTDHYYIWDPTLGGTPVVGQPGGRGAYSLIDLNEGTSTAGSTATIYLQPMQAAFFQTSNPSNGTPKLYFKESYKAPDQPRTTTFSNEGGNSSFKNIQMSLYTTAALAEESTPSDGLSIKFRPWSDNAYDPKDGPKFNNLDENLARNLDDGAHYLALEYRNMPVEGDSLGLFINQYRYENYTFQIVLTGGFDHEVFLKDNYLDERTPLVDGSNLYGFSIDESIPESIDPGRFSITFGPSTLDVPSVEEKPVVLYPNPLAGSQLTLRVGRNSGKVGVQIYNMLGQQVYGTLATPDGKDEIQLDNLNLQAGVYVVQINAQNGKQTAIKLIKK